MESRSFLAKNVLDKGVYEFQVECGLIRHLRKIEAETDLLLCPGAMIDTQVNGYLGYDYSDPAFKPEMASAISQELAERGTLQHFPTIVTRPQEVIVSNIDRIVEAVKHNACAQRSITGIHVEGPFISRLDGPRGAHDLKYVRPASLFEFDEWLEHSDGLLKYITLGAEVENACELIRHAVSCGVRCSIGHSGANRDEIDRAVDAGASLSTHLGNGVFPSIDRFDNAVWPQLRNSGLAPGIIADGAHLAKDFVWIVSRCKDADQIMLVSDLAPCAGLAEGLMKWGDIEVDIRAEAVWVAGTNDRILAGAASMLLQNAWNYARFTGTDPLQAFRLGTVNPTRIFGLDPSRQQLAEGMRADFITFRNTDSGYSLDSVYSDGNAI